MTARAGDIPQAAPGLEAPAPRRPRRILVLKLDHHGDFIIGLPALERLRAAFPADHITLVCGGWNESVARQTRLADEIIRFDFYPENTQDWDGRPVEAPGRFGQLVHTKYDIAIDLRADEDTRRLLEGVDASIKCGLGTRERFPFLTISLPGEPRAGAQAVLPSRWVFPAGDFETRGRRGGPFLFETDFSIAQNHFVWGPYITLPGGRYEVAFGIEAAGVGEQELRSSITFDVAAYDPAADRADVLASTAVDGAQRALLLSGQVPLRFDHHAADRKLEFRIFLHEAPYQGALRFHGVKLDRLGGIGPSLPGHLSSGTHVGERLDLLVELIAGRFRQGRFASLRPMVDALLPDAAMDHAVFIAPFSNSTLRDWPLERYEALIDDLAQRVPNPIGLLGARSHQAQIDRIISRSRHAGRLFALAGTVDWEALPALLGRAALVISNNSGIAHLAAAAGAPTLAIYSGSHTPEEWGPRGPRTRVLTARVPCSPCALDRLDDCTQGHRCMTGITPQVVRDHAMAMLAQYPPAGR
jgi:ADP-heptose:LPS heptosyltransferase